MHVRYRGVQLDLRLRVTIYEPEHWAERIDQYYAEQAARPQRPVLVPIQV